MLGTMLGNALLDGVEAAPKDEKGGAGEKDEA
jgi:hypothetical protein